MKNIYKILLAAAGFGLLGVAAIFLLPRPEKVLAPLPEPPACGVDHEMFVIRGDSLAPQFAAGQEVKLFFDYYDCHPLAAGDAVAYRWAGNKDAPIAKIVKAVAGDHWRMEPVSEQNAY